MIPQQYILRRWTKNLIPATLRNQRNRYGEKNVIVDNFVNEATSIVEHCVHFLSEDELSLIIGFDVTDAFSYAVTITWQVYGITDVFCYGVMDVVMA
nr:protein FAR1-related sequence 5 [Tanacetum cinerariifolium]